MFQQIVPPPPLRNIEEYIARWIMEAFKHNIHPRTVAQIVHDVNWCNHYEEQDPISMLAIREGLLRLARQGLATMVKRDPQNPERTTWMALN